MAHGRHTACVLASVAWLAALPLACGDDGGSQSDDGSDSGSGAASAGTGGPQLPACVGTCEPGDESCLRSGTCGFEMCDTDADCPATDHEYTANGPLCVEVCGTQRLCRTPCEMGCPMGTSCNAIADDGTEYCEIELTRCDETTSCGEFLVCIPSLRPKP